LLAVSVLSDNYQYLDRLYWIVHSSLSDGINTRRDADQIIAFITDHNQILDLFNQLVRVNWSESRGKRYTFLEV